MVHEKEKHENTLEVPSEAGKALVRKLTKLISPHLPLKKQYKL